MVRLVPFFLLLIGAPVAFSATAAAQPSLTIGQLAQAPTIDGVVTDEEWSQATVLDAHLVQLEPEKGARSPFRTSIRIGQTPTALYVAFEAYDPEPQRIAAAGTARDGDLDQDDSVAVMLDTFMDRRTAYVFQTNAISTQWDGRVADNGRTVDSQWDAAWTSASGRSPQKGSGWVVEMEIPFSILRFSPGSDRSWGIGFLRTVPRRLETALWGAPTEDKYRVSNFGTLTGLDLDSQQTRKWQVIPYALATVDEDGDTDFEAGADLRWRPTRSLAVDLTANPDFALIEADVEQINLSRFELFIPEKRPFFLEGSETYRQRIRQFYSRRLGDITWGSKAIGTSGKTNYSALVTSEDLRYRSDTSDASGRPETLSAQADYAVVRAQRGLGGGSTLGLLASNRRFLGQNQGSVGLDTTLFFSEKLGFTGQLLRVHGDRADGGLAWFLRPAYDSNTTHFHVRYTNLDADIEDDFNTVGFLRDDDRREWDTNFTRTFFFEGGAIERLEAGTNYNRFSSQQGVLRSYELDTKVEIVFRNRLELEIEHIDEFQLFEKEFYNDRIQGQFGWNGRKGRSIFIYGGTGVNFDSDLDLYGAEATWALGDRFRLAYSITRLELSPDPEQDTTLIQVLESVYSFTPDNFVRIFAQTNTAIDKVNVQAVWVWRFLPPFGSLQVAYQTGTSERGVVSEQGDTLFSKFSWVF